MLCTSPRPRLGGCGSASRRTRHVARQSSAALAQKIQATVVHNRPCSLDERIRMLTLSVDDPVEFIEGRRMARKRSEARWLDSYTCPGQKVDVSCDGEGSLTAALASAPTTARMESANLDASIVQVVIDADKSPAGLGSAEPGCLLSVSDVRGTGFMSPVSAEVTLTSVLEEKRPLLVAVRGVQGIAAVRAALQWDPLQAVATEQPVTVVYITSSRQAAAFMTEWDSWRAAGISVFPLYINDLQQATGDVDTAGSMDTGDEQSSQLPDCDRAIMRIEEIFQEGGEMERVMGQQWKEAAILFSGLSAAESKAMLARLTSRGVPRSHILQSF